MLKVLCRCVTVVVDVHVLCVYCCMHEVGWPTNRWHCVHVVTIMDCPSGVKMPYIRHLVSSKLPLKAPHVHHISDHRHSMLPTTWGSYGGTDTNIIKGTAGIVIDINNCVCYACKWYLTNTEHCIVTSFVVVCCCFFQHISLSFRNIWTYIKYVVILPL